MKKGLTTKGKTVYAPEIMKRFREIYQEIFAEQTKSSLFGEQWHGFPLLTQARKIESYDFEEIYDFSNTIYMDEFAEQISLIKRHRGDGHPFHNT